ncbi:MAG: GLPGLI family protein [Bacteroidota bacterium]|uniref:GLPGLI family protein n=1 Tax=Flagellimonas profundi TaxID=2915620 RepID=A0ABS3FFK7_9FLAO|nr:GLPGLI family protein [Allomuricauda profundi]MBO0341907.1 GLPGLI family protein [Allomuricauda profundi]MEC7770638.1 GLPGLI family protein [Bacteroidota bacterium]
MKKYSLIYIVAVLFGVNQIFAQITSGKILYNVSMEDYYNKNVKEKEASPQLEKMHRMTADAAKNIQLELIFNQEQSIFQHQKGLSISDFKELDEFVKYLIAKGVYFTNLTKGKQILQTSYEGRKYNVRSEITKQDWTLTKEKKEFEKFICNKAVLVKEIAGKNREIIAWYAPEIPVSFGPVDYVGNLPGLILELKLPIATYTAGKIELNPKKDIKIDWPKDIDTMTEEEYKKEGDKVKARLDEGW